MIARAVRIAALCGACLTGVTLASSDPIAPMLVFEVPANGEVEMSLLGYGVGDLSAHIVTLPSVGTLYQLSQTYAEHGVAPRLGDAMDAPGIVEAGRNRLIWKAPVGSPLPAGQWTTFTYKMRKTTRNGFEESREGVVWLLPPHRYIERAQFTHNTQAFEVVKNGAGTAVVHERLSRGALRNYIVGADSSIAVRPGTFMDAESWEFSLPSSFSGNLLGAVGGSIEYTWEVLVGDAATMNANLPLVRIHSASADSNAGVTLGWFPADRASVVAGGRVHIPLTADSWRMDPKSSIEAWGSVTECEFVEVLADVTSISILGDVSMQYEEVALDDVGITAGGSSPAPLSCFDFWYQN